MELLIVINIQVIRVIMLWARLNGCDARVVGGRLQDRGFESHEGGKGLAFRLITFGDYFGPRNSKEVVVIQQQEKHTHTHLPFCNAISELVLAKYSLRSPRAQAYDNTVHNSTQQAWPIITRSRTWSCIV